MPWNLARLLSFIDPALQKRLASGAAWNIIGAALASGLAMLANVAAARMLGSTDFGKLGIVLATTNIFTTLFAGGLSMTAARYVAEYRDVAPDRAGKIVGLSWVTAIVSGGATALLIVPFSPWLSRSILDAPGLGLALSLGAAVMFFGALNGSQTGALSGLESFRRIASGNLVKGIATILFVIAGAKMAGIEGALAGYVVVGVVTALYFQLAVRRECAARGVAISYRFGADDLKILWRFTLPVLLTTMSFTPAAWWSNVVLATKSGYDEAGVFAAVFQWSMLIQFFSSAVSNMGLPMLANCRAERDPAKYRRYLAINFAMTSAPAVAIALPVALFAPWIMRIYGPGYQGGATALVLISAATVIQCMGISIGHAIWSLDATRVAVLLALLRGGVLVAATYAFADYGATGLAGAHLVMGIAQTVGTIPFVIWLLRSRFNEGERREEPAGASTVA
jgi:O-antigen/teichoic acid export membrane protein